MFIWGILKPLKWFCIILLLYGVTLFLTRCNNGSEALLLPAKNSIVLDTGKRWVADSSEFTPPLSPPHTAATAAIPFALPYQQSVQHEATEQVMVQWYTIDLPADQLAVASSDGNVQLYIPRIHIKGSVAIYWNHQRLWYSRGNHFYNGFYRPIWLSLPFVSSEQQPPRLWIRMAGYKAEGQTLSRAWMGSTGALMPAYTLRKFLQTDIVRWIQSMYWSISFWVFVVWLFYRRYHQERFHLWFAAMAFTVPFTLYGYLYDYHPSIFSDQQLLWATLAVMVVLNHTLIKFIGRFVNADNVLLEWLSSVLTILVLSFCALQLVKSSQTMTVTLFRQAMLWFILPFVLYLGSLLVIFSQKPNRVSAFFLSTGCLNILTTIHDIQLHLHRGFAEGFLWGAYTYPIALFIMVLFILNNYIQALKANESANRQLQTALAKKEKELTQTHKKLSKIEAEQTLAQERHRLMQEMHDGVGSSLVYAMHSIKHRHSQQSANDVVEILQTCMEDLKIAIDSLEPINGDLTLLLGNLRYRLATRFKNSQISVNWQVEELSPLDWLEATNSIHILRILQEVLTNIFKYSNAKQLTFSTRVELQNAVAGIVICIEDDGIPFHCPSVDDLPHENKGIRNIIHRCHQLNGHCHWQPRDTGNQFSLWLPLKQNHTIG